MPTKVDRRFRNPEKRDQVEKLLLEGMRRRDVATRLAVGKNLVDEVAAKLSQTENIQRRRTRLSEGYVATFAQRCRECGRKVLLPCLACAVDKKSS